MRLFYQVVMGTISMEAATEKLLAVYSGNNVERVSAIGSAPIAILTLDKEGRPLMPGCIAISSFAWGLRYALQRELATLGDWPRAERTLIEGAEKLLQTTEDEAPKAVDRGMIDQLFRHLQYALKIPNDCISPPQLALRVYQYYKAEDPPDPPPMGSFFLQDLPRAAKLVSSGGAPDLVERYVGVKTCKQRCDLRTDNVALADALAPAQMPLGQWPTPGGPPLVLLQQAAVSLALSNDDKTKLLPVNGPPGTGKTTLLREIVVSAVVTRARVLASFTKPSVAFKAPSQKFRSGNAFTHFYSLDRQLHEHGIVVASSNNKAVENVSAELPSLENIDAHAAELRYFKTVSDNVARRTTTDSDDDLLAHAAGREVEPESETWGLIAAVLGNTKNRNAFRRAAWNDEDYGLRPYLLEASGNPQIIEIKDPTTGRITDRRKPRVVIAEKPPADNAAALRRWNRARKQLADAVKRVEERMAALEAGRIAVNATASSNVSAFSERHEIAQASLRDLHTKHEHAKQQLAEAAERFQRAQRAADAHRRTKPSFLGALFSSAATAVWEEQNSLLTRSRDSARQEVEALERDRQTTAAALAAAEKRAVAAKRDKESRDAAVASSSDSLAMAEAIAGDRFVDAAFFAREADDLQRDTAWLDAETLRMREEVFVAAMRVHRAFVDGAAKEVRNNLDLLFRSFFGRSAWTDKVRPLMPDLWATFFCVVPVVSTTFASVERMFGYLGPETLGWLLIDEAGQAVPQAAIGALMRARRAIVVGDPLQLPPVTRLPTELAAKIADEFKVDERRFLAPTASVQTLADDSCTFGTLIRSQNLWVGLPLIVHRRCANPMFRLSNNLAYDGMMVHGRGNRSSVIRDILGPARWFDVRPARCEDKWSEAEGRAVIALFRKLEASGLAELDIYVITPFRIVAQKLRELLVRERVLTRWTSNPREWVKERVGTVYTVQGREADSVIFVLGAAEPERRGARNWAGQDVNQLNVAITRAKENLYVVGNRFEWASAGHFAQLEAALP